MISTVYLLYGSTVLRWFWFNFRAILGLEVIYGR